MQIRRIERLIPDLTGALVLIIAVSSFVLSFCNLQATAIQSGINLWLSWMFPLCIDALLIAGSMMILRESIRGENTRIGWSVLIVFTCVSIVFNVSQSPEGYLNIFAHLIAPVSLCVSTEILMIIIRGDIHDHDAYAPNEHAQGMPIEQDVQYAKDYISNVHDDACVSTEGVHMQFVDAEGMHKVRIDDVHVQPTIGSDVCIGESCALGGAEVEKLLKTDIEKAVIDYFTTNPLATISQAADELGFNRNTISKYKKKHDALWDKYTSQGNLP